METVEQMKRLVRQFRDDLDRLLVSRAERGPYRYLIRRWSQISDVDLAVRVLNTDFFRQEVEPLPLPIKEIRSILVIAPHQDDEIIGAGGTLLAASAAGVRIEILYVTDGAQRRSGYASNPEQSSRLRNREAREVCSQLGANIKNLEISNLKPEPTVADLDRLNEIISQCQPDVLMTPWLLDGPVKHRLVNHLLWLANERGSLPNCEVWGYQVHNTLYANGYVDITDTAEQKRELLGYYDSQNRNFKRYDHMAMGLAAWNSRYLQNCPETRYAELFFTLPLREFLKLVGSFYVSNLEAIYRGERVVLDGARHLQGQILKKNKWALLWRLLYLMSPKRATGPRPQVSSSPEGAGISKD
jgi:N-acetylglucosamine malate deacetylase 1